MNLAVVGAGNASSVMTKALQHASEVEVAFVLDRDPTRSEGLAAALGAHPLGVRDQDLELVARSVSGVIINTPTETHSEWVAWALSSGLRVLVAKPLSSNLGDALEIERLRHAVGGSVSVIQQMRHLRHVQAIEALTAKRDQPPHTISLTHTKPRLHPGSLANVDSPVVTEWLVHHLDIVLALMGRRMPDRVMSDTWMPEASHYLGGTFGRVRMDWNSTCHATIEFGFDTAVAEYRMAGHWLDSGWLARGSHLGSQQIHLDVFPDGRESTLIEQSMDAAYEQVIKNWVDSGSETSGDLALHLDVLRVAHAARESDRRHRPIDPADHD